MRHRPIHEWVSDVAAARPDAIAIQAGDRRRRYGELESDANRLANLLLANGAVKGSIVALVTDDAIAVVTGILGALKAGAIFAPLSPQTPGPRLAVLLAELEPAWIATEGRLLDRVASIEAVGSSPGLVVLDDAPSDPAGPSADRPVHTLSGATSSDVPRNAPTIGPDDMCYVYFTSGSTGTPKGIAGRFKAIDHFIQWEQKTFGIGEGIRVTQLTAPVFDASLRDFFVPLTVGGTVCALPNRDDALDASRLIAWLDATDVNLIHCVPSIFRLMLTERLDGAMFPGLRHILMAGEPLLPADVERWTSVFGDRVQLVNLYGPSETTMIKFFHVVGPSDVRRKSIPIGKPIEGARAILADKRGRVCAPGAIGEIYIRTPYLSLGYYRQPELTRQVFVPNPFTDDPADLVYKTGDLGRLLDDGTMEFLGRQDQQVKVRGVRIELSEIESALRTHPAVNDVAVIDRDDGAGTKYLCAYVVLGEEVAVSALREHVAGRLPAEMLPSAFVKMDTVPRTLTGKVDRRALPAPAAARRDGQPIDAPCTPVEGVLAGIWAGVLGLDRVAPSDNFFTLGGHSLLATLVLSRLRAAFHVDLPLRTLFETPTLAALAARVEDALKTNHALPAPIERAPRDRPLPLSFAQQRLWFLDRLTGPSAVYNIAAALLLEGEFNVAAAKSALDEILARHDVLRTSFRAGEGPPEQVIAPAAALDVPIVDLRECDAAERAGRLERLIVEETQRPFDLATGPLVRAVVARLRDDLHQMIFTVHHIAADDWSIGLCMREFAEIYNAHVHGRPSPLPPLPIQYADFAVWERARWQQPDEQAQAQLDYWRSHLKDLSHVPLPADRPRPPVQTYCGATESVAIPRHLVAAAGRLARREGATLFMVLLAALQALLHRYTGSGDVAVGSPIANRTRRELEPLIGFFANTIVLRTYVDGALDFRQLVALARETAIAAYMHQDVPFDKLVDEIQPARDASRNPLVQVVFTLQNAPAAPLELHGLTVTPTSVPMMTAKFDWLLVLRERDHGLSGIVEYNSQLFDRSTVARMWRHFLTLLEDAVAHPDARVAELALLSADEQRVLAMDTAIEELEHDLAL